jgi:lipopolysaccharide/colanic/teichoic acid biosynthesis glycosyltransferase
MSISTIPGRWQAYQTLSGSSQAQSVPTSVRVVKRGIDIAFALVGLLLLGLVLPLIALAIYLDSPGPLFYRQRRASLLETCRNGRCRFAVFDMLKFRTMRTDAEVRTGAVLAQENDPRVTRVGRFLRRTRLDELPQFWNVLTGDMSLVGPRPERPELLENLTLAIPFFEERMRGCKPGITGLAQISLTYSGGAPAGSRLRALEDSLVNPFGFDEARGALADDMRTKLLFDLGYVAGMERFWTYLLTELSIIVKTPLVMLKGVGR